MWGEEGWKRQTTQNLQESTEMEIQKPREHYRPNIWLCYSIMCWLEYHIFILANVKFY